jgi:CelD/BcsL family acetyltransferase involved in cellulose biosynthesis
VIVVRVSGVEDFAELGVRWRDLEDRAALSFFQSWTWVGCLAVERFSDPVLVEATEDGRTVALALFNRVRRWIGPSVLYLGESGSAELDCPYVEQNGVLAEAGRADELTERCLRAVASRYDLVLSGVGDPALAVIRRSVGSMRVGRSQASPFVDLAGLRRRTPISSWPSPNLIGGLPGHPIPSTAATGGPDEPGHDEGDKPGHDEGDKPSHDDEGAATTEAVVVGDYLAGRSANTRQQIRRSDRLYERGGRLAVDVAGSVEAAHTMLEEMAVLHQATWLARGRPGSFAEPFFRRFHRALIARAVPRGEAALLKVSCDQDVVGILYNFVHRGRMSAYQSGFAYRAGEPQAKPGLTCHYRAIQFALDQGLDIYDFLAGEDRYKRSLADSSDRQNWVEAGPVWSPRLLFRRVCDGLGDGRVRDPCHPFT